jgi:hypothetical protein
LDETQALFPDTSAREPTQRVCTWRRSVVDLFPELASMLIFFIGLFAIDLNRKGKLIVGGIYILATAFTLAVINLLPYPQYQTIINIAVVVLPLTVGVVSYIRLRDKFQQE